MVSPADVDDDAWEALHLCTTEAATYALGLMLKTGVVGDWREGLPEWSRVGGCDRRVLVSSHWSPYDRVGVVNAVP